MNEEKGGVAGGKDVVLEAEFVPDYIGRIVSTHDGYSYINIVKRGFETIATNGDVFVPAEFPVGAYVEFSELNSDPKRPGKFRTESAKPVEKALTVKSKAERALVWQTLNRATIYHAAAKKIDPENVAIAVENEPFAEEVRRAEESQLSESELEEKISLFLRCTFPSLQALDVSFSVTGESDEKAEAKMVEGVVKSYKENGLDGQVDSLKKEYDSFKGIRQIYALLSQNGLLLPQTLISVKYVADLLVTCPVWYVHSKNNLPNNLEENDPLPDEAVRFFSDLVPTREFAWFYQMYNRRTRPIKMFSGRDIIPPKLAGVIGLAKQCFDFTVIATPYHDLASREWQDRQWLRNIDPFLFGFKQGLPHMFFLGRWSGTGLFPLMCDMVADTMSHLKFNKAKLGNFAPASYWYRGFGKFQGHETLQSNDEGNYTLSKFAEKTLQAYEAGRLFQFLRGETA